MKIAFLVFCTRVVVALVFGAFIGACIFDSSVYILAPTPRPVEFSFVLPEKALFLPSAKVETGTFKISTNLQEWSDRLAENASPAPPIVTWKPSTAENKPAVIFDFWLSRKDGSWYHAAHTVKIGTPILSPIGLVWGNGNVIGLQPTGKDTFFVRLGKHGSWFVGISTLLLVLMVGYVGLCFWLLSSRA